MTGRRELARVRGLPKTAETVARGTGAKVVPVTQFPGGVKGTEGGYIALMDYLVNSLAAALGEKI